MKIWIMPFDGGGKKNLQRALCLMAVKETWPAGVVAIAACRCHLLAALGTSGETKAWFTILRRGDGEATVQMPRPH